MHMFPVDQKPRRPRDLKEELTSLTESVSKRVTDRTDRTDRTDSESDSETERTTDSETGSEETQMTKTSMRPMSSKNRVTSQERQSSKLPKKKKAILQSGKSAKRGGRAENHHKSKDDFFFEKREALEELKYVSEQLGMTTHLNFDMKDSLNDIKIEIKRLFLFLERRDAIQSMRNNVAMVATGLEMANYQFGNHLSLSGFSKHVGNEALTGRFDLPLQRIYKKHWKTGAGVSQNPEFELAKAIVQSAGMFHLQKSGILNDVLSGVGK